MKVGIIGALEVEIITLRQQLSNHKETKKAGFIFYEGLLHGVELVLLQSGIGKVNASIGATLMIAGFAPDYIINTGSAGGFSTGLQVGDIVISSDVLYHDMDCTALGFQIGQVPDLPPSFKADKLLIDLADNAVHKLTKLKTKQGTIITGDQFMNDPERTRQVKALFPQAEVVEMEGAAIAQTCFRFKVPFVIIRSVSDIAGQEHALQFEEFVAVAGKQSADIVLEMIRELTN